MPYFDHAWTEYNRHLGLFRGQDAEFVMRASTVEYHAPARFDDLLECFVRVARIGRTSLTYECAAYRLPDGVLLANAAQTLVSVDLETRQPTPIHEGVRDPIRAFEGADLAE
jgi:acyl-CoA thioester hydrolase